MKKLSVKLKIWRQKNQNDIGKFIEYDIDGLNEHMSFLEMLDVLNENLISNNIIENTNKIRSIVNKLKNLINHK